MVIKYNINQELLIFESLNGSNNVKLLIYFHLKSWWHR